MTKPKPGYLTTEFWSTILIDVFALVAIIYPGHDFSQHVQQWSLLAAGIAQAGYSLSRGYAKN